MAGRFDARADIFWRREDARAEVALPNTVHYHARRGWAVGIDQPSGEAEPVARRAIGERVERLRHIGPLDALAGFLPVAAFADVGGARFGSLREREGGRHVRPVRPGV